MNEMWRKFKVFIGDLWGKTTTIGLALVVAIMPTLQALDPSVVLMLPAWAKLLIGLGGVLIVVMRFLAPPPPAVTIRREDTMTVNHSTGSVHIIKADGLPETMVSKAAGDTSVPPPLPPD